MGSYLDSVDTNSCSALTVDLIVTELLLSESRAQHTYNFNIQLDNSGPRIVYSIRCQWRRSGEYLHRIQALVSLRMNENKALKLCYI